ncbi:MAG: hypothetical protein JW984_11285 [Deltaproteobacteria bacterium]|uniref:Uncharacterized protein n=1 Tax=Candidatus Zymogenus saltonus TaxID=2844893 RepID=A0A9D8PPW6_9DELT|nr:hypothetical protein [Candidatus Zymogenus saltonus]
MNKKIVGTVFVLVLFLFGFQECPLPGPIASSPQPGVEKASVNGKYSDLTNVIDVPDDRNKYGDFYELGYKEWRKYKDYKDLEYGYWVYVYPSWYIWKKKTSDEEGPIYDKASIDSKYRGLLKTLNVPDDRYSYKDLYEGGYRTTSSYRGNYNLPKGYWVYLYPYWYIWENKTGDEDSGSTDEDRANVNNKYNRLLKTIYAPNDKNSFRDLYEWGYRTVSSYRGNYNLPRGYWVYSFPYWYIWESESGSSSPDEPSINKEGASFNGRYGNLKRTLYVPDDRDKHGTSKEFGYMTNSTYYSFSGIPSGYWVYYYPYMYIWGRVQKPGHNDERKASFSGKYGNIREALFVPKDEEKHGKSKEFGYRETENYYEFRNLPPGYWVYYYPYMYIWGSKEGEKPDSGWNVWDDGSGSEPQLDREGASFNGKYSNLRKSMYIPDDRKKHGNSKEFGYRETREYYDFSNLPPGYWVYYYPYMCIWGSKEGEKPDSGWNVWGDGSGSEPQLDREGASFNGKYSNLRKSMYIPDDKKKHGNSKEFGYRETREYYDFSNLPPGYWVYYYPYMCIWGSKEGEKPDSGWNVWGDGSGSKPQLDREGSSFSGKYSNLRKSMYIPDDKKKHGNSKEFGYRETRKYYDFSNLPPGYWVYYYPYMCIWGNKRK